MQCRVFYYEYKIHKAKCDNYNYKNKTIKYKTFGAVWSKYDKSWFFIKFNFGQMDRHDI